MSDQAATRATSYSKGLILAILVDRNELSLRELILCFVTCKNFRDLLDSRGFCLGTAWLCACLEGGQSPTAILSRLRSARGILAYERPLSRVDQVTSFLMRHEGYVVKWGWAWAQLLYQEPDGGMLCEGVKKMRWILKHRLIKELHKSTGYHRHLCTWTGHSYFVRSVAWSPCGKFVASGSKDSTVKIWDAETCKTKCSLKGHSKEIRSVAWSPCGNFVASGSDDRTVRIWDIQTGSEMCSLKGHSKKRGNKRLKCTLTGHSDGVSSVAWSPDGKLVASGSWDKTIRIWDVATGKEAMGPLKGHSGFVSSVVFSPDGKQLASGSLDNTIRIWDVATGKEAMGPLTGHSKDNPECTCWDEDGDFAFDWDCPVVDPRLKCTLTGHSGFVSSVAWSPCGKFVASGSGDGTIKIWDVVTGSEKCSLKGHYKDNPECTCTHGYKYYAANPECLVTGHSDWVRSVAWSPDGKLVASGSDDKSIRIWDVATGKEAMGPLTGHSDGVSSVAWSPDGKLVASGSWDKTIRIWDVAMATGKEAMDPLKGHSGEVLSVAWSPDGKTVASGSDDRTVRLWDVGTGKEKCSLQGHSAVVNSVAFSPDGKYVASGSGDLGERDNSVRIWEVATAKELCSLTGHSGPGIVFSVAWSPDGKTVVNSSSSTVWLWDVETGSEKCSLKGHSGSVRTVAFSPNGVRTVAFSPDGKTLAIGSTDNRVRLWDVETGSVKCTLKGHSAVVNSVAFSPDGKYVASGSGDLGERDNSVRIWEVATAKELCSLKGTRASWQILDPHTKELAAKVKQGGDQNRTGQYIVTADRDMVYVYVTNADGEERNKKKEPLACFSSPARVNAVSCMGTSVVVGCENGQVLFLEAPLLSA